MLKPSSSPAMPENNEITTSLFSWHHFGLWYIINGTSNDSETHGGSFLFLWITASGNVSAKILQSTEFSRALVQPAGKPAVASWRGIAKKLDWHHVNLLLFEQNQKKYKQPASKPLPNFGVEEPSMLRINSVFFAITSICSTELDLVAEVLSSMKEFALMVMTNNTLG